jgi:hypothetical protein
MNMYDMNDMRNAKKEFLQEIVNYKVIGAKIDIYGQSFELKLNYTKNDWDIFLNFLDQDYDSGYGGQNLYGTIFCDDGIWLTRGVYDGAEWWDIHCYPDLNEYFDKNDVVVYNRKKKLKMLEEIKDSI